MPHPSVTTRLISSHVLTHFVCFLPFSPPAKSYPGGQPVLVAMATNMEVKYSENQMVRATSGTIGKANITMQALGKLNIILFLICSCIYYFCKFKDNFLVSRPSPDPFLHVGSISILEVTICKQCLDLKTRLNKTHFAFLPNLSFDPDLGGKLLQLEKNQQMILKLPNFNKLMLNNMVVLCLKKN